MNYSDQLVDSAERAGNIVCMGLDPSAQTLRGEGALLERATELPPLGDDEEQDLEVAAFSEFGYWRRRPSPRR